MVERLVLCVCHVESGEEGQPFASELPLCYLPQVLWSEERAGSEGTRAPKLTNLETPLNSVCGKVVFFHGKDFFFQALGGCASEVED